MRRLAILLVLVAACADAGRDSGTLRYYLSADPVTLDPALSTDVQSGEMITMLFDNLVRFDVEATLVPGVATRWEVDSTATVYTFHLSARCSMRTVHQPPGTARRRRRRPHCR